MTIKQISADDLKDIVGNYHDYQLACTAESAFFILIK